MVLISRLTRTSFSQLICLMLVAAGGTLSFSQNSLAQNVPVEGVYTGAIEVAQGPAVQMSLQMRYSATEVPAEPGDVVRFKKQIVATFTIENEAGPYSIYYANYNIVHGQFDLYYVRPAAGGSGGGTATVVSAPAVYNLHFQAKFKDNVISGRVDSGQRGDLGAFSIKLDPKVKGLATRQALAVGSYQGNMQFPGAKPDDIKLFLSSSAGTTTNPADLELDNTPSRIGSLLVKNLLQVPFNQIYIDYFTHTIRMNYANATNGATLAYSGTYAGDQIVGTGSSGFNSQPGTFTVKRIP